MSFFLEVLVQMGGKLYRDDGLSYWFRGNRVDAESEAKQLMRLNDHVHSVDLILMVESITRDMLEDNSGE